MNVTELGREVAAQLGCPESQGIKAVKAMIDAVSAELAKGGEVRLRGLGSFNHVNRAARIGRNPQTGEAISIPAKQVVKFRAAKELGE